MPMSWAKAGARSVMRSGACWHYDFEKVEAPDKGTIRYRCEDCGAVIEIE